MPNNVTIYDLLISCPGDVVEAVKVIEEVVESFNQKYNSTLNIGIRTRHWEKSSYPQSGGRPQELLNKQFVEDCDLAVAIFKTRFGTSTDKYDSGSEEEIEIMLNAGKQVFLYFDVSPVSLTEIDLEQYQKVKDFEEKYRTKGIYHSFKSIEEFRSSFDAHITQYFLTMDKVNEITSKKPELTVSAICKDKFVQDVDLQSFDMGNYGKSEHIIDQVKVLINDIPKYRVTPKDALKLSASYEFMTKEVKFDDSTKHIIEEGAKTLGLKISDDFFDLGNLKENISPSISGGKKLRGSDSEIEKYNSIIKLRDLFYKLYTHLELENYYGSLKGIQLILSNSGTTFDEDIEVVIRLPKNNVVLPSDLRVPNHKIVGDEDWCFEDIFTISSTKDFTSYEEANESKTFSHIPDPYPMSFLQDVNFEEEYRETLADIFDYKYFEDNEFQIIKCHFDYIKQHQRVAFPTWLFLKNVDSEIKITYTITSKNVPEILDGEICVNK